LNNHPFSCLIPGVLNLLICALQRDSIQAASSFAHRHQLPVRLQDQMLAHIWLKYRTDSEGLQQQEILDSLPKAIRSSISVHLFYSFVDQVYLFRGVSSDLIFQLVMLRNLIQILKCFSSNYLLVCDLTILFMNK